MADVSLDFIGVGKGRDQSSLWLEFDNITYVLYFFKIYVDAVGREDVILVTECLLLLDAVQKVDVVLVHGSG